MRADRIRDDSSGGIPAYLELATVAKLPDSLQHHLEGCHLKQQGWTDTQIIMSLILLNIAGGDCVDDLRILERDEGLVKVLRRVGFTGHPRKERREQVRRWRKECKRSFPSASVVFRYLNNFVNPEEEKQRGMGKAFIPAPNKALSALGRVNPDLLSFAQKHSPQTEATLDMDASIVETSKQDALFSYKGSPVIPAAFGALGRTGFSSLFRVPGWQCAGQLSKSGSLAEDLGGATSRSAPKFI